MVWGEKLLRKKNHNSRAHDGQNTHSWCRTCSKRAAHLARTLLGSTTIHQEGEGKKREVRCLSSCPFSLRWGLSTQRHFNSRQQKQGFQCRPARDPARLHQLESQVSEPLFRPQRWGPRSISCEPRAVSGFHSDSKLAGQGRNGRATTRPTPSLSESRPGLCFSPPNTLILSQTTNP